MAGGVHAPNNARHYKVQSLRAFKRRVAGQREHAATVAQTVVRKPAVVFSNNDPSKKRLRRVNNKGLARALEKLKSSGVFNKAPKGKKLSAKTVADAMAMDVDAAVPVVTKKQQQEVAKRTGVRTVTRGRTATRALPVQEESNKMDVDASPSLDDDEEEEEQGVNRKERRAIERSKSKARK